MRLDDLTRLTDEILLRHLPAELRDCLDGLLAKGWTREAILHLTRRWAPKNGLTDLAIQAYLEGAARQKGDQCVAETDR